MSKSQEQSVAFSTVTNGLGDCHRDISYTQCIFLPSTDTQAAEQVVRPLQVQQGLQTR